MSIDDIIKNYPSEEDEDTAIQKYDKIRGKIYHLGDGYAFVSSDAIPYTRIYAHWQALEHNTLHFTKLKIGMELEFKAIEHPEHGWRAIKVRVVE